MSILSLRKYPDRCLLMASEPVKEITPDEARLMRDMAETMYANGGIGLAAPQVGVNKRIAVVDAGEGLLKLVNPEIVERKGRDVFEEGCLSVSGACVKIARASAIKVRFRDGDGRAREEEFGGMTAKAIQQEIDHLDGRLILDFLPWHKKVLTKLRLRMIKK